MQITIILATKLIKQKLQQQQQHDFRNNNKETHTKNRSKNAKGV